MLLPLIIFFSYPRVMSELAPDSFSQTISNGIIELEQKYPNKKFIVYTCTKKYGGPYNASAFSILFFLELKHKFSDNGIKIAVENDCEFPAKNELTGKEEYPLLSSIGIRDFSSASNSAILEAGWKPLTFAGMYNQYARWWFELQP